MQSEILLQIALDFSTETLLQSFLLGLWATSQKLCTANYPIDSLSQLNALKCYYDQIGNLFLITYFEITYLKVTYCASKRKYLSNFLLFVYIEKIYVKKTRKKRQSFVIVAL